MDDVSHWKASPDEAVRLLRAHWRVPSAEASATFADIAREVGIEGTQLATVIGMLEHRTALSHGRGLAVVEDLDAHRPARGVACGWTLRRPDRPRTPGGGDADGGRPCSWSTTLNGTVTWPKATAALSPREAEIIRLVARDLRDQEIADQMFLSITSVKTYIRLAYRKIGVATRVQAVVWAIEHGFGAAGRCSPGGDHVLGPR